MRHFNTELFNEILRGLKTVCKGANTQTVLSAATEIYLASVNEGPQEGIWKVEIQEASMVRYSKIVECPFCRGRRAAFVADTLNFCPGCGAKLEFKCSKR